MQRKVISTLATGIGIVALFAMGYAYWLHEKRYPSTDDAYIQAHVINVAAQVSGRVQHVYVRNQQRVTRHQLLFTINPKPFQIALSQAQANLANVKQQVLAEKNAVDAASAVVAQRKAELLNAQKNSARILALVKDRYYAKAGGDDVIRRLAVAQQALAASQDILEENKAKLGQSGNANARIQIAQALLAKATLNLHYTQVTASENGDLAQFTLQPGQTVTAYEPLFSLVENNHWWAIANMKETNLNHIRVGQKAAVAVDMYPSHHFKGIVKSIGAGSGSSFSLLPSENATGNWVKVTQRFPVRIEIENPDAHFPLRIGASCTVTIDTQS